MYVCVYVRACVYVAGSAYVYGRVWSGSVYWPRKW